jgi:predicted small secreted protein
MKLVNINKLLVTVLCTAGLLLAAGCATIEGAGEDIESVGESVQDTVDGE